MTLPPRTRLRIYSSGRPSKPVGPAMPLRSFVILMVAAVATFLVYHRTDGDVVLSWLCMPLVYAALERLIGD